MRFVEAKYDINAIPDPTTNEVYRYLERIGKVCYKSEDKITNDSSVKYLQMIRDRKHWAMLEHYVFVMKVSSDIYHDIVTAEMKHPSDFMLHEKLKFIDVSHIHDENDMYIVSGSATSFNYIWECPSMKKYEEEHKLKHGLVKICNFLNRYFPHIMNIPVDDYDDTGFLGVSTIRLLSREEIKNLPAELREIHDFLSVKFITNLGVSHDLVRSRPASYAMESTRWINYSKKCRFTYTIPLWFTADEKEYLLKSSDDVIDEFLADYDAPVEMSPECISWMHQLRDIETSYKYFANEMNYKNDQLSLLLPKNYKTELTVTTRIHEWKHIFFLRCKNDVRPDMRKIIVPLVKELLDLNDEIWQDQKYLYEGVRKDD